MRSALLGGLMALAAAPALAAVEEADPLAQCAPATVAAAVACIDTAGAPSLRDSFAKATPRDMVTAHRGFGMWVRNNWGLWKGGALAEFFRAQGIAHPDNMSGYVLSAYWLKAHGCRLDWNDLEALRQTQARAAKGESVCETRP